MLLLNRHKIIVFPFLLTNTIKVVGQKIGAGLSYNSNEKKLSFVAMAPMISIKNITQVFSLDDMFFGAGNLLQKFIDYVDFNIENFKLAAELDLNNKDFQARYLNFLKPTTYGVVKATYKIGMVLLH